MFDLQKPDAQVIHLIGSFDLLPDDVKPDTHLGISTRSNDLMTYWKRCGLLANFVARFFSFGSPGEGELSNHEERTYNMISQALNELVENAAKYSRERCTMIEMELQHFGKALLLGECHPVLRVDVTNEADVADSDKLAKWSAAIFETDDLEKLYLQHLEAHAEGSYDGSLLGLIMLIKDYPLKVGFKIIETPAGVRKVISRAYFILDQMAT